VILHHLARRLPERWRQTLRAWTTYQRRRRSVTEHGYSLQCFDEYRCIYYHIPKTAGLSVCQGLFGHHGPGHIDARTYRLIFGRAHFEKYFRFTFVRNPWDRLVSAYHFLQAGGLDREDRAWLRGRDDGGGAPASNGFSGRRGGGMGPARGRPDDGQMTER